MIIAIDLDDVLAASLENFIAFYNQKFDADLTTETFTGFSLHESIGFNQEKEKALLEEYDDSEFYMNIQPMKGALEAVQVLQEKHELIIITSRPQQKEEETKGWLEQFFPSLKKIIFTRKDYHGQSITKAELCKKEGASVLVEDNPSYAQQCVDKGIKVFLFDYPYNRKFTNNALLKRVKSWKEILEELK